MTTNDISADAELEAQSERAQDRDDGGPRVRAGFGSIGLSVLWASVLGVGLLSATGATAPAARGGSVAITFTPWTDFDDAVSRVYRAGGIVTGPGGLDGVVHAIVPEGPDARLALRAEGALLITSR